MSCWFGQDMLNLESCIWLRFCVMSCACAFALMSSTTEGIIKMILRTPPVDKKQACRQEFWLRSFDPVLRPQLGRNPNFSCHFAYLINLIVLINTQNHNLNLLIATARKSNIELRKISKIQSLSDDEAWWVEAHAQARSHLSMMATTKYLQ